MNSLSLTPRQPTVQQMVLESPARARVFEKYGIGYCCQGGGKSLQEACRDTTTQAETLETDLQQIDEVSFRKRTQGFTHGELTFNDELRAGKLPNWQAASLDTVADHVVTVHHATLRVEVPRLVRIVDGIVERHGDDFHRMGEVQFVLHNLRTCLESHMNHEEEVLSSLYAVPRANDKTIEKYTEPLGSLEQEHAYIALAAAKLRWLTDGFQTPEKTCVTFRVAMDGLADLEADLCHHLSEEHEMLFARVASC